MKYLFFTILSFLMAASFGAAAQALGKLDSDQPIEIAADSLEVLQGQRVAIFSGNVEALQGNITLKAQKMKVFYRGAGDQSESSGFGAVSRIEVEREVMMSTPDESANAAKGIYNVDKQVITLLGDVVLARGKNMLRGARLDYNLKTQKSLLSSGGTVKTPSSENKPSGGRVKGVFVPGQ